MCKKVVEYIVAVIRVIVRIFVPFLCFPEYEPDRWNDGGTIQQCNNCYNYGCNIQTNTFAQPGYANGISLAGNINCQGVSDAAIADGLKPCDPDQECQGCGHKVALVIDPDLPDYHWYRKDRNGMWSHKGGGGPASDRDYVGNTITDPRTADRRGYGLNYSIFCGFFCVLKGEVEIAGWLCNE